MIHQLRIYTIAAGRRDAYVDRFDRHCAPIIRRDGFTIVGSWLASHDGRDEFVYLLAWPDARTRDRAWARFLADDEWIAVKAASNAEQGTLVESIVDRTLVEAGHGPASAVGASGSGPGSLRVFR